MLHKDTISDESILSYSNMDVFLTSPQPNLNGIPLQKSMNQIANIPQPNCNMFIGNKQLDNIRAKQCSMRQIIPNQAYINNGVACNRQILNSNQTVDNANDRMRFNHLYQIAECYNPIDKLTLPVDNGEICGPLVLSNNQLITEYNFNLTEESLNEIIQREDLDIVLFSRLAQKDNSINLLRWPPVCISINDNQLALEMKHFTKIYIHLPQYIKNHCVIGRNVVKFEIFDSSKFNMAAFHFYIYMVHRPTIVNAKQLAINNAFISDDLTFKLLRENCMALHRDFVHISTLCPITKKRIEIPSRLKCCTHLQPFDLVGFLKMQARWMLTTCPLCNNSMTVNFNGRNRNIVIDKILNSIFEKVPIGFDMVRVNVNASFNTIPNSIYPGIEYNQGVHHTNNVMVPSHGIQHVSELNGNMIMHQSQPLPPNYRPTDQSMNFQIINGNPYRMIHTPINPMSIDSRSMLDLNPSDEQSMQSCMKYPHQIHVSYASDKPLAKKPVKRKLSRKSTPKTKIDANPNITNNTNHLSNGAITPPSTRTSSVASTSSPDSLNVPHMNLKRPPSIDLLSNTVLSDCHLSSIDEMALFSATSVSQMNNNNNNHNNNNNNNNNNLSFISQPQIHQPQQQHYQHLYQLPPESKPIPNWSNPEHLLLDQQHFQQHLNHKSQHQQIQQLQIQQQQQHQQIQQQQQQQQHQQHQQIQQHQHIQQQQQIQQQIQQQQQQQQIQQQQQQIKQEQEQQQFLLGLSSSAPSLYQSQNSVNTSYPGSVKQESSSHYPPSVKQEPLNYPPSVKLDLSDHPQPTTVCLDNSNGSFTHQGQQLSNSSCSSSINSFADHILSTYDPISAADELPWLEGFNFSELRESVNLSDMDDF